MDATGINRMKDKNHLADHHNRSRKGFDKIQHFLMIKRVKKKKKRKRILEEEKVWEGES